MVELTIAATMELGSDADPRNATFSIADEDHMLGNSLQFVLTKSKLRCSIVACFARPCIFRPHCCVFSSVFLSLVVKTAAALSFVFSFVFDRSRLCVVTISDQGFQIHSSRMVCLIRAVAVILSCSSSVHR